MLNFAPLSRNIGNRDGGILANVNGDVLGTQTILDTMSSWRGPNRVATHLVFALFGMLAAASEQARRFDPKVADLFGAAVHGARRILFFLLGLGFLEGLFLGGRHGFFLSLFALEILKHGPEVAFGEI